jgi:hypothetical protein
MSWAFWRLDDVGAGCTGVQVLTAGFMWCRGASWCKVDEVADKAEAVSRNM